MLSLAPAITMPVPTGTWNCGQTSSRGRFSNGVDFFWDEQGRGNCWEGNKGPDGAATKNDPSSLPDCRDQLNKQIQRPVNASKSAREAPCATWNPQDNQFPPGCDWFDTPPEPR